jgi:predicted site-specific integrase-resolvase
MISVDEAAVISNVSTRTMFHWVDEGRVHYTETANGLLRVCPNSLT